MTVAERNIVRFENRQDGTLDLDRGRAAGMVYVSQRSCESEMEHDARGFVIAILLCMCCWGALGFFLLS